MFRVLNNNKPAYIENTTEWSECEFETKREAVKYTLFWLGIYGPLATFWSEESRAFDIAPESLEMMISENIELFDNPYDFNGYGDTVQIIEVFDGKQT